MMVFERKDLFFADCKKIYDAKNFFSLTLFLDMFVF
jgi:hypothetical protein